MRIYIKIIICWITLLVMPKLTLYAAPYGTVISVTGQAEIQTQAMSTWKTLFNGATISAGDRIRTRNRSSVRLLNPDGTMLRIAANQQQTYSTDSKKKKFKSEKGVMAFLSELFDHREQKRITAVRALDAAQSSWIQLLQKRRYQGEDLELIFELMAHYQEQDLTNRTAALAAKLYRQYPDNQGFKQIASLALNQQSYTPDWQVLKIVHGKPVVIEPGSRLTEGDNLQISYQSARESYYYLFLTTRPDNGQISTMMIYPQSIIHLKTIGTGKYFSSHQEPGTRLILPSANSAYPMDDTKGTEVFWGWSCCGPVENESAVRAAVEGVEASINKKKGLLKSDISQSSPDVCRGFFTIRFKHD